MNVPLVNAFATTRSFEIQPEYVNKQTQTKRFLSLLHQHLMRKVFLQIKDSTMCQGESMKGKIDVHQINTDKTICTFQVF